jgi:hypothetical protein
MTHSNERQDESPRQARRQRAMRVDVHIAHEALKVASPANEQIGPWQQRAAWLHALAERRHARGKRDPAIAEEARELLLAVERRRKDLRRSMATLPAAVAESSRLEDTVKALDSITGVLRSAIGLARSPSKG